MPIHGNLNRKDFGYASITDQETGRVIWEGDTLQCVHCQGHWVPQPGSGRVRGWCTRCHGPICGPACVECVPAERYLESLEKQRPLEQFGVSVSCPADVSPGGILLPPGAG